MKFHLIIVLLLASTSLCFGQMPSASPTPQSESAARMKTFGSSLEKYKNKSQRPLQVSQNSKNSDAAETISIKTNLVVNDVLVTDQNGKMITDIKRSDFIVSEDNTPQTIEMFSAGENASLSRFIVLVIVYAGEQRAYLRNSIQAAKLVVDQLSPNDKMAIVSGDVKLMVDFTMNKILLKSTLDSLEKKDLKVWSGGDFNNLLAVLNEMFTERNSQRITIFQSGGNDILTLKPDDDTPYQIFKSVKKIGIRAKSERNFGFSDIKEAIERSHTTIYSIIPGIRFLGFSKQKQIDRAKMSLENQYRAYGLATDESLLRKEVQSNTEIEVERRLAGQTAMSKVAELSGGETIFMERPNDAETIYSDIFKNIENRYIIGYYPKNQEQDGKLRTVKIEVRNHPEYKVRGRQNYYFGNPETK